MSALWYDIAMDSDPDDPDWYDIERIYCFEWEAFSNADWKTLRASYAKLPNYETQAEDAFPRWFSRTDDPENGYLWASVESAGLQVAGTLRRTIWDDWDRQFRAATAGLPFRQVDKA